MHVYPQTEAKDLQHAFDREQNGERGVDISCDVLVQLRLLVLVRSKPLHAATRFCLVVICELSLKLNSFSHNNADMY